MKYDEAGVYEVPLSATDDCDNETVRNREVLVAREIIAGDNVTLVQEGNEVTINVDVCGALDECQTIIDMKDDIEGKQDILTAGDNITIENNVISADDPDLSNYYPKSETYNKTEVDGLIEAIEEFHVEIVNSLPQTGEERTIYLVPKQGGGYTEYMYINNDWEEIGDTDIDLSNYYDKSEVDALIADFLTCADVLSCQSVSDALDAKQDKLTAGNHITIAQDGTISATNMTKQEILTELGYTEIPISITDENDVTTTAMVLGYIQ